MLEAVGVLVWAQETTGEGEPSPSDWLFLLDRYGLPLVVLGVAGIVFRWLYLRALSDLDRERTSRDELEAVLRNEIVPALTKSTDAHARVVAVLERVEHRLDRASP